ncbi:hypothetical protein [Mesorhizobium qingshengii]|uniref:Uncharacterized protein n=1 Tax=Mesorhizobium qingshengii TaxID=1165689 RepID=A0A1G5ZBN4_9HYPH|nr:hypothetical protein [Mesorhizobium qingshengii]SDA91976.1 hypothetical protein SAMN02927914_04602 [Mesorhizobium qingshengii]
MEYLMIFHAQAVFGFSNFQENAEQARHDALGNQRTVYLGRHDRLPLLAGFNTTKGN